MNLIIDELLYMIVAITVRTLAADSTSQVADNGVGVGSSVLNLQVTRNELGATFTCKVNSIALLQPLTIDINLDVHGKYCAKMARRREYAIDTFPLDYWPSG